MAWLGTIQAEDKAVLGV